MTACALVRKSDGVVVEVFTSPPARLALEEKVFVFGALIGFEDKKFKLVKVEYVGSPGLGQVFASSTNSFDGTKVVVTKVFRDKTLQEKEAFKKQRIAATDIGLIRVIEDIFDVLTLEQKVAIPQASVDKIAERKAIRSEDASKNPV